MASQYNTSGTNPLFATQNLQTAGLINDPRRSGTASLLNSGQQSSLSDILNGLYSSEAAFNGKGIQDLESKYTAGGGKPGTQDYVNYVTNDPGYQALQKQYTDAQKALNADLPTGGQNKYSGNLSGILGNISTPAAAQNTFLDKVGGAAAAHPLLTIAAALPIFASGGSLLGAGSALGASGAAASGAGALGDVLPFAPSGFGAAGAYLPAATAGAVGSGATIAASATPSELGSSAGLGSTLSSYANKALNLPSTIGNSVTGSTGSQLLGDTAAGAVKGAAIGGGSSALTGQNIGKGILGGAVTGGITGGIGNALSGIGNAAGITGPGSLLGTANGTPLSGGLQGPTQGSGFLGGATGGTGSGFGSLLSKGLGVMAGGGTSGYGSSIGTLLGGANSYFANQKAQKDLLNAQNNALAQIQPYQNSGGAANLKLSDLLGTSGNTGASGYGSLTTAFNPTDLQNDPGYQFNLTQGNQALDRQQAAKGGYFSGAALKAGQDYGQGLADSTYNQAFNRDAATKAQQYSELAGQAGVGANAANEAGNIYQNIGNAKANAGVSSSNIFNSTLSSLLNGGNNNNALVQALLSKYS